MIRLTLLLLAAIVVTMSVAGREPETVTQAETTTPPVEVARAGTVPTALPDNRLALDDERGAFARALAATEAADAPEPEPEPEPVSFETAPGAVSKAALEVAAPNEAAWYVTGSRVNLREGPSTSTAVVGQAREGQRVEVLGGGADGWMRIRVIESGITAYIYGRFLAEAPAG